MSDKTTAFEGRALYDQAKMETPFRHLPAWDALPEATRVRWQEVAERVLQDAG